MSQSTNSQGTGSPFGPAAIAAAIAALAVVVLLILLLSVQNDLGTANESATAAAVDLAAQMDARSTAEAASEDAVAAVEDAAATAAAAQVEATEAVIAQATSRAEAAAEVANAQATAAAEAEAAIANAQASAQAAIAEAESNAEAAAEAAIQAAQTEAAAAIAGAQASAQAAVASAQAAVANVQATVAAQATASAEPVITDEPRGAGPADPETTEVADAGAAADPEATEPADAEPADDLYVGDVRAYVSPDGQIAFAYPDIWFLVMNAQNQVIAMNTVEASLKVYDSAQAPAEGEMWLFISITNTLEDVEDRGAQLAEAVAGGRPDIEISPPETVLLMGPGGEIREVSYVDIIGGDERIIITEVGPGLVTLIDVIARSEDIESLMAEILVLPATMRMTGGQ